MQTWFKYLKQGLSSAQPEDKISSAKSNSRIIPNLKNLYPYFKKNWRKGIVGLFLILLASLCGFPPPLIMRYLVDEVIIGRQTGLLAAAILLMAVFLVAEKLGALLSSQAVPVSHSFPVAGDALAFAHRGATRYEQGADKCDQEIMGSVI